MQKILSAIGIGSLTLVLLIALSFTSVSASHVQTPVSESSTSIDPTNTRTMFISDVKRNFDGFPPQYYYYDNSGWTGTLALVDDKKLVNGYQGIYEGYVQCTGLCPMSKQIDQ